MEVTSNVSSVRFGRIRPSSSNLALRSLAIVFVAGHMAFVSAQAQEISSGSGALPNVIDEEDRLEITATSAATAPRIDGMLDDAVC